MIEIKKVRINEDLFIRCSEIDPNLPFRLQKRKLFEKLGFPIDKKILSIPIQDKIKIKEILSKFVENQENNEKEFLIITSPKPMSTRIPPLFRVNREDKSVLYRDEQDNIQLIELPQILIKIKDLPTKSWIEFARYLWKKDTIAGRLVYVSIDEQILEIQKDIEIPEMDKNPKNSFRTVFSLFELQGSPQERELAHRTGFDWREIKTIVHYLSEYYRGFEGLKQIANLPAVEFAYTKKEGLLIIDVDWPAQYHF